VSKTADGSAVGHGGETGLSDCAPSPRHHAPPSVAPGTDWPQPRTAYYTLFVLVLCLTSSQLDVNIVPYLAASIKADLHLSDTQLGLLIGAPFALFYTLVGLPIAYFIDRVSRRRILALGIAIWNLGTALCGIAQSFGQLFVARFLVGGGEGVNGPASYSIVSDLFPRERLPRAVALLQLGSVIGPAIALAIGAWFLHLFLEMKAVAGPLGEIHGWQVIFILIGLPSMLIAALVLITVPEPARRAIRHQMAHLESREPVTGAGLAAWCRDYGLALRYMALHWRVFVPLFGSLLASALAIGAQQWTPIFYQRTFGWGPAKVAALQSGVQLLVVPLGLLVSVALAERFSRRRRDDAAMRVYALARLVGLPGLFYVLMPSPWLAFGIGTLTYFTMGMAGASQNAALQIITPAALRGKITALYLFIYTVVGVALAPLVNALITDFVLRDETLIRWAIFWPTIVCGPLSFLIAWAGVRPYGREVARLATLES
jgi:MFS family permease